MKWRERKIWNEASTFPFNVPGSRGQLRRVCWAELSCYPAFSKATTRHHITSHPWSYKISCPISQLWRDNQRRRVCWAELSHRIQQSIVMPANLPSLFLNREAEYNLARNSNLWVKSAFGECWELPTILASAGNILGIYVSSASGLGKLYSSKRIEGAAYPAYPIISTSIPPSSSSA